MRGNISTIILFSIVGVMIVVFVSSKLFFSKRTSSISPDSASTSNSSTIPQEVVIATVGDEQLFQKDLDKELSYSEPSAGVDMKKILLNKIVSDSIILQAAAAEKIVNLDASVFNNPTKDYSKRIELVKTAREKIANKADGLSGTVITIWFYNNDYVGPKGYDESKKIAYEKIKDIYDKVSGKSIDVEQAVDMIQNDQSLFELDRAYKTNASFDFDVTKGQSISFDTEFDDVLWNADPDEFTKIHVLKDESANIDPSKEVAYAFGYIRTKRTSGHKDFDAWFAEKKKVYTVTYK